MADTSKMVATPRIRTGISPAPEAGGLSRFPSARKNQKAPESFRRPGPWKLFNSCDLGSSLHAHAGIRQIGAQLLLPHTFWCSSAEMGDLYHWALGQYRKVSY